MWTVGHANVLANAKYAHYFFWSPRRHNYSLFTYRKVAQLCQREVRRNVVKSQRICKDAPRRCKKMMNEVCLLSVDVVSTYRNVMFLICFINQLLFFSHRAPFLIFHITYSKNQPVIVIHVVTDGHVLETKRKSGTRKIQKRGA